MENTKKVRLSTEKKILICLYSVPIYLSIKLMNHLGNVFFGQPVYTWEWVFKCFLGIFSVDV